MQRLFHLPIDARYQIEEGVFKVVEPLAHFVEDGGPPVSCLIGLPKPHNDFTDTLCDLCFLFGQQMAHIQIREVLGHGFELEQHCTPFGFGRVCREHWHNKEIVQQITDFFRGETFIA